MKTLLSLTIVLAPLAFGLAAWTLAMIWGFSRKRSSLYLTLSWCACAVALWFPLQAIRRWVENGNTAAILDCTGAYFLCATVLLAVNLFLTVFGMLCKKQKY